jgi:hypothetical protein
VVEAPRVGKIIGSAEGREKIRQNTLLLHELATKLEEITSNAA